jgi:hypothetical protein
MLAWLFIFLGIFIYNWRQGFAIHFVSEESCDTGSQRGLQRPNATIFPIRQVRSNSSVIDGDSTSL